MTAPDIEQLYADAAHCNTVVSDTREAYEKATTQRAQCYAALRDAGQSMGAIAKRLRLSSARVAQILAKAEADTARDETAQEA